MDNRLDEGLDNASNPANEQKDETKNFLAQFSKINFAKHFAIFMTLFLCAIVILVVLFWLYQPQKRPIQTKDSSELFEVLDFLDNQDIKYSLKNNTIYVAQKEYEDIKLSLSRSGVITQNDDGAGILMQNMGFGVSQRLEKERLKHSREQMLARAIEEIKSISRARVLLAIPKDSVFIGKKSQASATVVVTVKSGVTLGQEEIDSVVGIVASAVDGLSAQKINVSDNSGRLLNSGTQDRESIQNKKEFELIKKREREYLKKIDSIMIPLVGLGNYTAQVDLTMDFSYLEQTKRRYNPDLPALRSEMVFEEETNGNSMAGIPGALTNQPPLNSNIPEVAKESLAYSLNKPKNLRKEATRNYELDTAISHSKKQLGTITRLSVSVAINYKSKEQKQDEETTIVDFPYSDDAIKNIRRLLKGGIGFDALRGDTLEVMSMPFVKDIELSKEKTPIWLKPWFAEYAKIAATIFIMILLIYLVIKPTIKKIFAEKDALLAESDNLASLENDLIVADKELNSVDDIGSSLIDGKLQLPDVDKNKDLLQMVRDLVENEPELSIQVIRGWLDTSAKK